MASGLENTSTLTYFKRKLAYQRSFQTFSQAGVVIDNIVAQERKKWGLCTFMKAKESFFNSYLSFATQKNSTYLYEFNKGYKKSCST